MTDHPKIAKPIELRAAVLAYVGVDRCDDTTADGSADLDLAHERADAILALAEMVRDHGAPEQIVAALRAPSTQDETEWGYRSDEEPEHYMHQTSEESARKAAAEPATNWRLFRRVAPGPWVSVSSVEGDNG